MRALAALGAGALLLAGCETAFVGRAPSGRFDLVAVNGGGLPATPDPGHHCPETVESGHLDLDSVARRFELVLNRRGPCIAAGRRTLRETGSYLRNGPRLELEAASGGRGWTATESGNSLSLRYEGMGLRFRQTAPPPRR